MLLAPGPDQSKSMKAKAVSPAATIRYSEVFLRRPPGAKLLPSLAAGYGMGAAAVASPRNGAELWKTRTRQRRGRCVFDAF